MQEKLLSIFLINSLLFKVEIIYVDRPVSELNLNQTMLQRPILTVLFAVEKNLNPTFVSDFHEYAFKLF